MTDSQKPNKDGSKSEDAKGETPKRMRLVTYKEWQAKSGHGQNMFVSQTPNRPSKDSDTESKEEE